MKVIHLISRYLPAIGGSETWCSNICKFLSAKGVVTQVSTINLYHLEEFYKALPLNKQYFNLGAFDFDQGVFVRRYDLWRFYSSKLTIKIKALFGLEATEIGSIFNHSPHSLQMYVAIFNDFKHADIVHLHNFPYFHTLIGYWVAKLLKKKIIITPYFHPGHPDYERKIFYHILKTVDAVFAMTDYEKQYFIDNGVDPAKIIVTGIPIVETNQETTNNALLGELSAKYAIANNKKTIIFLGRKEMYKGIAQLVEAAKMISQEDNLDLQLFLVGPDTEEFHKYYSTLKDTGRLKIINFSFVSEEEKHCLLERSDLLVLASEAESFGIVFLEAWRHNKPVVGLNKGAIPEIIKDAGLCAQCRNPQDLKEKIKLLLFDQELSKKLGEKGKEKLKEYSLEKVGEKVLDTYSRIRKRNRVLIVSHLFHPYFIGGSEIVALEQATALKKIGFEIKVFAGKLDNKDRRHAKRKERNRFDITRLNLHSVDFGELNSFKGKETLLAEFREELLQTSPDIVHFHNIYPLSIRMLEVVRQLHIPIFMTIHDFWPICFKNILITDRGKLCEKGQGCTHCQRTLFDDYGKPFSLSERNQAFMRYLKMADLLISPSQYLKDRFIDCGMLPEKIEVINNGINLSKFKNIQKTSSQKIRFGFIGQIVEHKGLEKLLEAFSLLSKAEREKVSLVIVGTGEELFLNYCKSLAENLNLVEVVTFYGKINNKEIKKMLRNIDALIVPSVWPENAPVTIMEALATGTPVLASEIGGIPEFVQNGITGYLHPYDKPDVLAQNIRKLINNSRFLKEMSVNCLKKVLDYELSGQVRKIASRYKEIARMG